jgi:hypothetical protein
MLLAMCYGLAAPANAPAYAQTAPTQAQAWVRRMELEMRAIFSASLANQNAFVQAASSRGLYE